MPIKKSSWLACLALAAIVVSPIKALADEVWTTEEYDVVYEVDRDTTAVWSYGTDDATIGLIFIEGLAGVYRDRGSYTGYWAQESSSLRCDTFREGIDGEPTYHWGRFEVTFIDPDFPSRWHAHFGLCNQDTTIILNGNPVTAE